MNIQASQIVVDPQAPITINAQIASQVKLLIAMGELQPGEFLPKVIELAKDLGVNHNTVAAAYNDLVESGYLVTQRGKGTFVAQTEAIQKSFSHQNLYNLLSQAFTAAVQFGFEPSEFGTAAYAQAVRLRSQKAAPLKLVFVEGLQYPADVYSAIRAEIGLPLSFLCWEDLEAPHSNPLKELWAADLVITTAQSLWKVIQVAAEEQEVIAVEVKPDLQLLTQISSLPRHARVLLVAQEKADSEVMKKMLEGTGISHLNLQALAWESLQQNLQLLEQVDGVCASRTVEHYVRHSSPQPEKVIVFNFSLDSSNLSVLKARLAAIQLSNRLPIPQSSD
jgi:DNA-binding transcriptional regulator YhcF (GntR family)